MDGASDANLMTGAFGLDARQRSQRGFECTRVKVAKHGKENAGLFLFIEAVKVCSKELVNATRAS